jgi:thiol:disulfide interchange protein/DsbC/DsbD-like thiol-disulfide interchange protein
MWTSICSTSVARAGKCRKPRQGHLDAGEGFGHALLGLRLGIAKFCKIGAKRPIFIGEPPGRLHEALDSLLQGLQFLIHGRDGRDNPPKGQAARSGTIGPMSSLLHRAVSALAALALGVLSTASAATGTVRVDSLDVELVSATDSVRGGEPALVGLRIRHDAGWHTYWRNPGDSGLPTQVRIQAPPGVQVGEIQWPAPSRMFVGPLANYGFEGEIVLPIQVMVPTGQAGPLRLDAQAEWLVCREVCIPGEASVSLTLPVSAGPVRPGRHASLFEAMARRTPDPARPIEAALHRDGERLSLAFAALDGAAPISVAEFFPFPTGVVSAPAPQALLRTDRGWRLDLQRAPDADSPASIAGVLMADGRPIELRAGAVAGPAPAGTPVSVAQAPVQAPRQVGLLGSLLGGGGGGGSAMSTAGAGIGQGLTEGATTAPGGSSTSGLALMLGFGILGGLILNLMPCVFPVVGLKVLAFAGTAQGDPAQGRRAGRTSAVLFSLGVLLSFWVLAALILGFRAAGESIGWGFQLQSPLFVGTMALLFFAIGLNFSGVFDFGLRMSQLGGIGGTSRGGSFATGVLAVLVATPCTAPFMGSALGYTLARPALDTWLVFTAIGLGMALPYLVLGWFPQWLRWLPRPGRWMETFKQVLAFPMYATAAWLAWVLAQQAGPDGVLRLLFATVLVGFVAWAYGRFSSGASASSSAAESGGSSSGPAPGSGSGQGSAPGRRASAAAGIAALVAAVALVVPLADEAEGRAAAAERGASGLAASWQPWSEESVAAALADGRSVFVDFTAAWCVTCQANKALVLDRDPVASVFAGEGVVTMRADWTQRDPAITAALARFGRNGVPLYVVYRQGDPEPRLLPELLTSGIVLGALR